MKYFLFFFSILMHCTAQLKAQSIYFNLIPQNSAQLVLVKTPGKNSITGTMFLYERKNKKWKALDSFPVTVGSSGIAWDSKALLPHNENEAVKKEGDGKSPAGIFKLGPVFSYHQLKKLKMPFVQVDTTKICVDDINSAYYNRLTDVDTVTHKDWNSFEYMRRKDDLYEYGVWVQYNSDTIFAGDGSCIFLHVWHNENTPTAGCTALSKENMIKLIRWLDEKKKTMLLQFADGD